MQQKRFYFGNMKLLILHVSPMTPREFAQAAEWVTLQSLVRVSFVPTAFDGILDRNNLQIIVKIVSIYIGTTASSHLTSKYPISFCKITLQSGMIGLALKQGNNRFQMGLVRQFAIHQR